ncbi:MAG: hypothetical protein FJ295_13525 [Planctomycetes bacterium]|nr:hypothetical protein [Planctomycetota bacterium]
MGGWNRRNSLLLPGVLLMVVGGALRTVETITLTPSATRVLADISAPAEESARNALRQTVIEAANLKKVVRPPGWLGWSMLSLGFVLAAAGIRPVVPIT